MAYTLYENANSTTEDRGVYLTTITGSTIEAVCNAINTIEREDAVCGVWFMLAGREHYIEETNDSEEI